MKVRRVFKQISVFALIGTILATDITPAYAATSVAGVNETQDVSTDDTAECEVYAELGSIFRVIIPKKITLSGSSKSGSYTVDVEGDIGGTDTVKVVPEESFTLTSTGLSDQTAKVSQDKTQWSWNEILPDSKTIGNGSIAASGITAGSWNGSFWFNISLEDNSSETQSTLTLSVDDVALGTNDSVQVNAYLDGKLANDAVTWSSDNENIIVTNGLVETSANAQAGDSATITVTASNTENLSAMANVLSDLGLVTYAKADDSLLASFTVTVIDMAYTTTGEAEIITSLDIKAGESKDVEVTIIPASVSGIVAWSTTAPAGLGLITNGNTVTLKVASDMEVGRTYNLVATYGNFSKLLKINIVPDHVHSYESKITTEATCTEDGVKTFTCECGDSYTETISATGHSWEDDYTVDVEATCTTAGSKSVHCANCDATRYNTEIPATGHSYGSWTTTKEATCTVDGSKQRTCATCGNVDTAVITKLGHDYSSTYTVDKAATCTEAGSKSQHCSRCDAKTNVTEIAALGHNLSSSVTKESTCTEEGNKHFECSRCDYEYDETITAKGHTYVLGKYVIDKAATCTETGSKSVHCDVCDAIITGTEVEISATGHSYNAGVVTTEPTCTENGIKTFTCGKCNGTKTESVNKLGHSYSSVVTAPTCTEEGYTTHTCSRCDDSYVDSKVSAIGHSFGSPIYVWSADRTTCTATRVCANDTTHKETESATITSTVKVAATCTVKGTTTYTATFKNTAFETQTCDVEDIVALGHSYGEVTYSWTEDKSTCTASRTCGECSNVESEEVNSINTITTAATCVADGVMTYAATFTNADFEEQTTTVVIPATGEHNFENGTCTICGIKPGLYDSNNNLLCTWEESGINVETDYTNSTYKTSTTSPYYVITNNYPTATKIVIPDSVTSIGEYAFFCCSSLTSIEIPDSVTSIGNHVFYGCSRLTDINVDTNNTVYCSVDGVLFTKDMKELITYPQEKTGSYIIPNSVTSIGNYAFNNCTSLTSIIIPDSVTHIGSYAFNNCISLTSIIIPDSVTSIENNAFCGCRSLTSITIPDGVTSIRGSAFHYCSSLTSITIPDSVTSIGDGAFGYCSNLTSIIMPDSVTSIGSYAFQNCSSLTSATIGNGVTSIGWRAFNGCTNLTSVTFKRTYTWFIDSYPGDKSYFSTVLSSSDLANTSTAATYLTSTYRDKYWKR